MRKTRLGDDVNGSLGTLILGNPSKGCWRTLPMGVFPMRIFPMGVFPIEIFPLRIFPGNWRILPTGIGDWGWEKMTEDTYLVCPQFQPRAPNLEQGHIQSYFGSSFLGNLDQSFLPKGHRLLNRRTILTWTIRARVEGLVDPQVFLDSQRLSCDHFREIDWQASQFSLFFDVSPNCGQVDDDGHWKRRG